MSDLDFHLFFFFFFLLVKDESVVEFLLQLNDQSVVELMYCFVVKWWEYV